MNVVLSFNKTNQNQHQYGNGNKPKLKTLNKYLQIEFKYFKKVWDSLKLLIDD